MIDNLLNSILKWKSNSLFTTMKINLDDSFAQQIIKIDGW